MGAYEILSPDLRRYAAGMRSAVKVERKHEEKERPAVKVRRRIVRGMVW